MKNPVAYTFVASTKTVSLTGLTVNLGMLMAVINATRGVTYYKVGDPSFLATVSGSDIVLNASVSTSGHADSDKLFIVYEDGTKPLTDTQLRATPVPVDATTTSLNALVSALQTSIENYDLLMRAIIPLLRPLGIVQSGSGRISVDLATSNGASLGATTLGTVTTVASVTNQVNLGGLNAFDLQYNSARTSFADSIRRTVTF